MLDARDLKKSFGKLVAVDGVSFTVEKGTCVGLLGPNGAGKTTTVSMIAGILQPDTGEVHVGGERLIGETDPKKRKIGIVPQDLALYEELTAAENLRFFGGLYGLDRAALARAMDETLELVGLRDRVGDKVKTFSGGMKRRLNMAASLLHDPELLILDEPTVGVDPQSRSAIFDNLEALKARGKAILYTTHYMEEAERLCDRLVIMDHGKVLAADTLRGLAKLMPVESRLTVELDAPIDDAGLVAVKAAPGVVSAERQDGGVSLGLGVATDAPRVLAWLMQNGFSFSYFATARPNLESIFLDAHRPQSEGSMNAFGALRALIRKDLRVFASDRRAMIVSFAVPAVLATMMGFVFKGGGEGGGVPHITTIVVDQDGTPAAQAIDRKLAEDPMLRARAAPENEARDAIR